jgi:hypothetical protein
MLFERADHPFCPFVQDFHRDMSAPSSSALQEIAAVSAGAVMGALLRHGTSQLQTR